MIAKSATTSQMTCTLESGWMRKPLKMISVFSIISLSLLDFCFVAMLDMVTKILSRLLHTTIQRNENINWIR